MPLGLSLNELLGLAFMADRFDVVPVRTNDEGRIVASMVVRAQTRCTIVFAARCQGRAIERFDLLATLRRERQVKVRRFLLGLEQAQRNLAIWLTQLDTGGWPLRHHGDAERFECLEEECSTRALLNSEWVSFRSRST